MQMVVNIRLYHFYTTKKITYFTATVLKMRFVGSKVSFRIVYKYVTYCNQQSLSRCITCHRCLQQSHVAKRLQPQLEVKLCCPVTVTQWRSTLNNQHPSFATCLCRQCSGHEWIARSKLHDTTTVNPALVQCECHIRKYNRHCKN